MNFLLNRKSCVFRNFTFPAFLKLFSPRFLLGFKTKIKLEFTGNAVYNPKQLQNDLLLKHFNFLPEKNSIIIA